VLTGRDKGRQGAVIQVLDDDRLIVEGINTVKRHQRPNPQAGKQGGILSKEMPMHVSKVAIWNPATRRPIGSGFKILADGKKYGVSARTERCSTRNASVIAARDLMARLHQFYRDTVVPKLKADLQLSNPMEVPRSPRSRSTWVWARPWPTAR